MGLYVIMKSKTPRYIDRILGKPGVLIFKEKHSTRYFLCDSKEDFCLAAMKILRERSEGGWYDSDVDDEVQSIVASNDTEDAFLFLRTRTTYEYENMIIEYGEEYENLA